MTISCTMLVIASFAVAPHDGRSDLEPVVLAAETGGSTSPYVEISDLSPIPAKRIIRAQPKAETPAPQFAARQYDIAPLGAVAPATSLMPAGSSTVLQPVEPANTRPYIALPANSPAPACPCPPAAARTAFPSYPAAVSYPQVTYSAPVVPQVAYMPVAKDTNLSIGRGSIGQPKLYVDGQPVRNFLRWLGP